MKKMHQITLTPLSKTIQPEPDIIVCKKCNKSKDKEAFRKANMWRAKVCMECDYTAKKEKIAAAKKEKEQYGFF